MKEGKERRNNKTSHVFPEGTEVGDALVCPSCLSFFSLLGVGIRILSCFVSKVQAN
jgi:hypothetical protein